MDRSNCLWSVPRHLLVNRIVRHTHSPAALWTILLFAVISGLHPSHRWTESCPQSRSQPIHLYPVGIVGLGHFIRVLEWRNPEMAENVRVIVRCRPMNRKELDMKCKSVLRIDDCAVHLAHPTDAAAPPKQFTFDAAYAGAAPTAALYNDLCYALVDNVLDGYNGTIFAYGQTGCGKSHTMQGPDQPADAAERGIIQRSFDHCFEAISVARGRRYLAQCSYLEIYNEQLRDLLRPATASATLQLKELPGDGVQVANLSQHTVHTAADCERLLAAGSRNRIVAATLMNATSSRSHSIFTISLEQIEEAGDGAEGEEPAAAGPIRRGKLNLVDLAGSERQQKTGAAGDRLKEATKINLSLSALGNVISALVDGRRSKHVPYRDSRLTRLLQDSLGGNTKTLMVACVSPAAYNYDETLSTLRYAARAKCISNAPRINEDPKEAALREYQAEIAELRRLLVVAGGGGAEGGGGGGVASVLVAGPTAEEVKRELEREQNELRLRYEADASQLRTEFAAEQRAKEELREDMARLRQHYEQQMRDLAAEASKAAAAAAAAASAAAAPTVDTNNNGSGSQQQQQQLQQAQQLRSKVAELRSDLIGGERAHDVQLRERHRRKKLAAERRMSALGHALQRLEHAADRDQLATHYTDISAELAAKTDALRAHRQRQRALEREVLDVQAEFELDRADYLETIRRLQKRVRLYEQLWERAMPVLRRDGRHWDAAAVRAVSVWNDDTGRWRIPEEVWGRVRLPPAIGSPSGGGCVEGSEDETSSPVIEPTASPKLHQPDSIAGSYFRPRGGRVAALIAQPRGGNSAAANATAAAAAAWKTTGLRVQQQQQFLSGPVAAGRQMALSRTWAGDRQQPQPAALMAAPFLQPPQFALPMTPPPPLNGAAAGADGGGSGGGGGGSSGGGRLARPQAASTRGPRQRSFVM